jgi:hypothetical protein
MPGRPVTATLHEGPVPNAQRDSDAYRALEQLGKLMDSQFVIPGLGIRFGIDALLGLVPGIGDFFGGIVSLYILGSAARMGVSRTTIVRMALNLGIDTLLGALPFVGDLFDVAYKANNRNVALLARHVKASGTELQSARRADRFFVGGILLGLLVLLVGTAALTATLAWMLLRSLQVT